MLLGEFLEPLKHSGIAGVDGTPVIIVIPKNNRFLFIAGLSAHFYLPIIEIPLQNHLPGQSAFLSFGFWGMLMRSCRLHHLQLFTN